jgi:hypothetical protein
VASIEGNEQALDSSIVRALKSLGIVGQTDFAGLLQPQWIQDQGGVLYGNRLDVYRNLPRNPASALVVELGKTWYSLTLDPTWTTPQAVLGVSFDPVASLTTSHVLMPGVTVRVPNGFRRFWVWGADVPFGNLFITYGLAGYVRFLLGASAIDTPNMLGVKPHPLARLLGFSNAGAGLVPPSPQVGWVPTNVPRVRVYARAQNAAGAYVANLGYTLTLGQFSVDRPFGDINVAERPDAVVGYVASLTKPKRIAMSGYPVTQPVNGAIFGPPTALLRSMPGVLNYVTVEGVNEPTGVVTDAALVVEATDVGEIERETFEDQVLFDFTTGANTALDTVIVPVYGMRQLWFQWTWSAALAGAIANTMNEVDDAGTSHNISGGNVGAAGITEAVSTWGPGCTFQMNAPNAGPIAGPVPQRVRVTTAAAGVGITTRLRVLGVPK